MDISIALGGGGAKGNAHVGVLRRLEKEGFHMLAYDGLQKAIKGITSHQELVRNVSIQNLDDLLMAQSLEVSAE